ncbi:MAG: 3-oxoadipyl-CoA thiolase [Gammaproteobacteria bacterium]|jgi:acetyl-CoA C-acetyltransferase
MSDAYIYDGIRTPFGKHGGVLANVRPDNLLALVIKSLVDRNSIDGELLEDIIAGNTNQAGEDSRNIARNAALLSGLHESVAGITVNRLCGSGVSAVLDAARAVRCGEGDLFVACGVESMSRAPWVIGKAASAYARDQKMFDSTLGWRFPNKNLTGIYGDESNTETAENIAADLGISRKDSDIFALASQQKYNAARLSGFFQDELLTVEVPGIRRKDVAIVVAQDEHPRPETTIEKLSTLNPLLDGGVVTAGNASGINDGAAALLVGNRSVGEKLGLKPRGRIITGAVVGVEPRVMGLGPVPATHKVLERSGLSLDDMDVIEINEAFATQVLGCIKQMKLSFDDERINPNGGAIAIGHPLGASGARLVLTALRHLENTNKRYALVTMCIGIGQGIATVIERIDE